MTYTRGKTGKTKPQAPVRAAEIVREYGPFAGADRIHGVTHDGRRVWAATGSKLVAFDPESGQLARTLDRAGDAGTAFDGTHLYQIAEARIDKIDPATGDVVASIPAPGNGGDSGLAWAEGSLWVGQYRDRKIHQIDPETGADSAHHRVQPLRHRRDLGRRRAVARHLGRRRERHPPNRPGERRRARAAGDAARHRRQRDGVRRGKPFLLRRRIERQGPRRATSERRETMTDHKTGTREEWLAARLELLKAEKELTRRSDELARRRQELPWVRIDKEYRFETDEGSASLADLFRGRSQLLVYHFMFGPDYTAGCPSCSAIADGFDGFVVHLANHDVTLSAVSRAPLAKLQAYKRRMGWTFPWASSFGSDFNSDFNVWFTEEQQREGGIEYNYRREDGVRLGRQRGARRRDGGGDRNRRGHVHARRPGMSAFALEDGVVYHAYSAYARGLDGLWGMYQWLDRAPKGRNETGVWWRRHDEYANQGTGAR